MGQQIALQQKIQPSTLKLQQNKCSTFASQLLPKIDNNKQGFIKTSPYPFFNSINIGRDDNGSQIYTQKCKSLNEEVKNRKALKEYFTKVQILELIESTVYTLVGLQQQGGIYWDISSQNIFVVQERDHHKGRTLKFKLLPQNLVEESTFQRLVKLNKKCGRQTNQNHENGFTFSPQMIIALRAKQKSFRDESLLRKSNVFALGIILLEASTLRPSFEFYDTLNFDIYEQVIEQCLHQMQKTYGPIVTKIIANMVDFDFEERIQKFTELAKWILYELKDDQREQSQEHEQVMKMKPALLDDQAQASQEQTIQTLPVCFEKQITLKKTILTNHPSYHKQQPNSFITQKQNTESQNRIKIKVRQVSVYLEKNSNYQSDNDNKSRLLYSPFLNSVGESKVSDFMGDTCRQRGRGDFLSQYTRRSGLAFGETNTKTRRSIFDQASKIKFSGAVSYRNTQR